MHFLKTMNIVSIDLQCFFSRQWKLYCTVPDTGQGLRVLFRSHQILSFYLSSLIIIYSQNFESWRHLTYLSFDFIHDDLVLFVQHKIRLYKLVWWGRSMRLRHCFDVLIRGKIFWWGNTRRSWFVSGTVLFLVRDKLIKVIKISILFSCNLLFILSLHSVELISELNFLEL
jgi:hypothetical protein